MTGEFKDATEEEFEVAKKAAEFSRVMSNWWQKDKKIDLEEEESSREWPGTVAFAKWYREEYNLKENK